MTLLFLSVVGYFVIGSAVITAWWERDVREGRAHDGDMPLWVLLTVAVVAWPALVAYAWKSDRNR